MFGGTYIKNGQRKLSEIILLVYIFSKAIILMRPKPYHSLMISKHVKVRKFSVFGVLPFLF